MLPVAQEATTADSTGEKAFTRALRQLLWLRKWRSHMSERCEGAEKDPFTQGLRDITGTTSKINNTWSNGMKPRRRARVCVYLLK